MHTSPSPRSHPWSIVIAGLVSLAIAMGIGRFAFTPLMPLMLRDGTLDAVTGTEWAGANYIGYLMGALTASWFGRAPRTGIRWGLIGVALVTACMAWATASVPWVGALLRASAGVFSAWVLVCTSGWCLSQLVRSEAPSLGGWIYTGVGVGTALAGVVAWLGGNQSASLLWIELGVLAAAGTAYVVRSLAAPNGKPTDTPFAKPAPAPGKMVGNQASVQSAPTGQWGLVLCFCAFGFGYIIPATYLPTMARQLVSDPLVFGLTWPVFGAAAALSVAFATRWLSAWPRRKVWAAAQGVMALGTLIPLCQQSLWALTLSAILVGGTFMVTTMAGLQLARERMPSNPTALLARMTSGFAAGQISGPLLVRWIGSSHWAGWDALSWANAAATVVLAASALWLWRGGRNVVVVP